jgi:hypothetical protein
MRCFVIGKVPPRATVAQFHFRLYVDLAKSRAAEDIRRMVEAGVLGEHECFDLIGAWSTIV